MFTTNMKPKHKTNKWTCLCVCWRYSQVVWFPAELSYSSVRPERLHFPEFLWRGQWEVSVCVCVCLQVIYWCKMWVIFTCCSQISLKNSRNLVQTVALTHQTPFKYFWNKQQIRLSWTDSRKVWKEIMFFNVW